MDSNMINVRSSTEMENAFIDLMGVTVKEEVSEEGHESASGSRGVRNSLTEHSAADGPLPSKVDGSEQNHVGADSLESPSTVGGASISPWNSVKCIYCQQVLISIDNCRPKLLECLHSACEGCINAKIDEKMNASNYNPNERLTILCASCKIPCQPANMIDHQFVSEIINSDSQQMGESSGEQHCNSCSDDNVATSYCVDCAEYICDSCVQAHKRLKITKDHTIKSKEEATNELQAINNPQSTHELFCKEHPQERLSLFCETCDKLTCRDCQLSSEHRDHKHKFSNEMALQARQAIANLLSEVSYKRVLLGSAMKVIRDRQNLIADKKKDLVHEITQTVVKLTNTINTRGKQLVLRLNEVCDAKQKTLTEKKLALEHLSQVTDHCIQFVNSALDQGSDTAVLFSKRQVTQHLQRIKSRRADIPNPEIPVRINLALDKVPDLIKVLSNMGGIVVDGKLDCPYAPPTPPPPLPAHHGPPTHQSGYGSSRASPSQQPPPYNALHQMQAAAAVRHAANVVPPTAAMALGVRHPHVTSTTHPHHLHGMNPDLNLRGLLNQTNQFIHQQQQQQQQQQQRQLARQNQQAMVAYQQAAAVAAAYRMGGSQSSAAYMQQQQQTHATPQAKWHIPQNFNNTSGMYDSSVGQYQNGSSGGGANTGFKITLGRQQSQPTMSQSRQPATVTSTNPKTPSPSLNTSSGGDAATRLDAVCAESVQDLMATIAKLDSNGVQVLPERAHASPHVHSSTDDNAAKSRTPTAGGTSAAGAAGTDPNEDWCAVCMDGGELMCCDNCPKVFHHFCHIPTIEKVPDDTEVWQCLLCTNFAAMPPENIPGDKRGTGLTPRQLKIIERLLLELYCQYETSIPFREAIPADNLDYHSKISHPMSLDMIRGKLQPGCDQRYEYVSQFVADVRLMFRNAKTYNMPDSLLYKEATKLEEFFDQQLEKLLPEYAYFDPGTGEHLPGKRPRSNCMETPNVYQRDVNGQYVPLPL